MPFKRIPPQLLLIGFVLVILIVIIQFQVFSLVLTRLGLSSASASVLLIASFAGSMLNMPIFYLQSNFVYDRSNPLHNSILPYRFRDGYTLIAVNVGGGLVPALFSLYLILNSPLVLFEIILGITIVSAISYFFSRPVANLGIGMPIFIAPVSAAIVAMLLAQENAAALAYISGSLGVIIGADLLRFRDVKQLNAPIASIGGAGTFDGIFITGIIAVLLAMPVFILVFIIR